MVQYSYRLPASILTHSMSACKYRKLKSYRCPETMPNWTTGTKNSKTVLIDCFPMEADWS
jgi:hypothetical protein